jgi:hypothetical protein
MCLEISKRYKCGCNESIEVSTCKRINKINDLMDNEGYTEDNPRIIRLHGKCKYKSAERFYVQPTKCESCIAAEDAMDDHEAWGSVEVDSSEDGKTVKDKQNVFGSAVGDGDNDDIPDDLEGMTRETTLADSEVYDEDNIGSGEDSVDETDNEEEGEALDMGEDEEMEEEVEQIEEDEEDEEEEEGGDGASDVETVTTGFMIRESDPDKVEEEDGEEKDSSDEDEKRMALTYGQVVQAGDANYVDSTLDDEDMEDDDEGDIEGIRAKMKADRDYLRALER